MIRDDGIGFEPDQVVDGFGRYDGESGQNHIGGTVEIKSRKGMAQP